MRWIVLAVLAACAGVAPRFPQDVQTTLAHDNMRRLETERFIIYYPAARRAQIDRFLVRADRCAKELRTLSVVHGSDRKMVIVMPDSPFNNAFVMPDALGYQEVAIIPTHATLDFTTMFGLPPDPGLIGCHELVHYVHVQQTSGFWGRYNSLFGHIYTPQIGYDPWFFEGLATYYEAKLTGVGRPVWPIFTGMFAAAYAGKSIGGGDLSALARQAPTGHHYLVGSMFFRFLAERYGERPLWTTIAAQSSALTGWFFTGTFDTGFGVSFGTLLDEFETWVHKNYKVRPRPPNQRTLDNLGNDARYTRGRDGTEAWVTEDLDSPPRLVVRDARGTTLLDTKLVEILPPRTLVDASPLLISGLSITADGREVWLTAIDTGGNFQVPRLLRWRRGGGDPEEITHTLGPGATISPRGDIYYYCHVDGDRWNLARYTVATGKAKLLVDMKPGTYVLGAQVSSDGTRLAANVWDGSAFKIWIVDATTGAILQRIGTGTLPVFDGSFTTDGRVIHLGVVDGRFQAFVDGTQITDAPYAVLAPRESGGTLRFLSRIDWSWELAEVAIPEKVSDTISAAMPVAPAPAPAAPAIAIQSDRGYHAFDHFFYPQTRSPTLTAGGGLPHIGLSLGGADRLELHRWALAGFVQPKLAEVTDKNHYGGYVGYANSMLAPVTVLAEASFLDWAAPIADETDPMNVFTEERRTRDAFLGIFGTYRNTLTLTAGGSYTDDAYKFESEPWDRVYAAGPSASFVWYSVESTRYVPLRRALLVTGEAAFYPDKLSTFDGNITDIGGTLGGTLPLPLGRRHTITAYARGRALLAQRETNLLQVGGDSGLAQLWRRSSISRTPPEFDASRFPPNLAFIEPLRGYEDYAITTDSVSLGDISWRYPLIIDRGIASTIGFLPATYLRQLDLELFAAGAMDDARKYHYAVGASTTLRIQFLRIPLAITYQIARRLVDDEALTQLVGIAPDL